MCIATDDLARASKSQPAVRALTGPRCEAAWSLRRPAPADTAVRAPVRGLARPVRSDAV